MTSKMGWATVIARPSGAEVVLVGETVADLRREWARRNPDKRFKEDLCQLVEIKLIDEEK